MVSVCKDPIDEPGEADTWHLPDAPERSEEIHMKGKRIAVIDRLPHKIKCKTAAKITALTRDSYFHR
jgi:hypothetical protein